MAMGSEQDYSGSISESDFDIDEYLRRGVTGYMFEPNYAPGEQSNQRDSSSEDEIERVDRAGRLGTHDWCKCGQCDASTLAREKECICGMERIATKSHAAPSNAGRF